MTEETKLPEETIAPLVLEGVPEMSKMDIDKTVANAIEEAKSKAIEVAEAEIIPAFNNLRFNKKIAKQVPKNYEKKKKSRLRAARKSRRANRKK